MSYSYFDVNSANPAADLYGVTVGSSGAVGIAGLLTAAGFTLVDTVTISTRTHKVWKSPAASNAANLDWYLDVAYTTTGAGSVWFFPFEDYNATTHVASRGAIQSGLTTFDATTCSLNGSTTAALESATGGMHAATATSNMNLVTQTSILFRARISATPDRIIAYSNASTGRLHYCGLYTPTSSYSTLASTKLFPLCVAQVNISSLTTSTTVGVCSSGSSSSATFSFTRVPPLTAIPSAWTNQGSAWSGLPSTQMALGTPTNAGVGWPIGLYGGTGNGGSVGSTAVIGKFGELKDVYSVATDASQNDGDTLGSGAYTITARLNTFGAATFKAI